VRFAVADEDSAGFDFQDARVGDGDFKDVGGEVFEGLARRDESRRSNRSARLQRGFDRRVWFVSFDCGTWL